jgi:hypothetical protein
VVVLALTHIQVLVVAVVVVLFPQVLEVDLALVALVVQGLH